MLYRFKPFKSKSLREILMCSFSALAVYQPICLSNREDIFVSNIQIENIDPSLLKKDGNISLKNNKKQLSRGKSFVSKKFKTKIKIQIFLNTCKTISRSY